MGLVSCSSLILDGFKLVISETILSGLSLFYVIPEIYFIKKLRTLRLVYCLKHNNSLQIYY